MNEIMVRYISDEMNQINDIEELMTIMYAAYMRICKVRQQEIIDKKEQCAGCPFGCYGIRNCIDLYNIFHSYFEVIKEDSQ